MLLERADGDGPMLRQPIPTWGKVLARQNPVLFATVTTRANCATLGAAHLPETGGGRHGRGTGMGLEIDGLARLVT